MFQFTFFWGQSDSKTVFCCMTSGPLLEVNNIYKTHHFIVTLIFQRDVKISVQSAWIFYLYIQLNYILFFRIDAFS